MADGEVIYEESFCIDLFNHLHHPEEYPYGVKFTKNVARCPSTKEETGPRWESSGDKLVTYLGARMLVLMERRHCFTGGIVMGM